MEAVLRRSISAKSLQNGLQHNHVISTFNHICFILSLNLCPSYYNTKLLKCNACMLTWRLEWKHNFDYEPYRMKTEFWFFNLTAIFLSSEIMLLIKWNRENLSQIVYFIHNSDVSKVNLNNMCFIFILSCS